MNTNSSGSGAPETRKAGESGAGDNLGAGPAITSDMEWQPVILIGTSKCDCFSAIPEWPQQGMPTLGYGQRVFGREIAIPKNRRRGRIFDVSKQDTERLMGPGPIMVVCEHEILAD